MLTNNIEVDIKVKCIERDVTQGELGEALGMTGQYVNKIINGRIGIINKTFVKIMEALGYDITFVYTPRKPQ